MATGAPGNLRKLLNANGKNKPKKRRRRKGHKPPSSGAPQMPPALRY